ncbi:Calx-beta domain-containing protein, partial [uncultured Chloroflexus sp.]|uniref:Calx-beta domain-containing protein n=2 Tax=Chloroflexus TaxID=1107 RepID=UPI002636F47E
IDETITGLSYEVTLLHVFSGGDPVYNTQPSAPFVVTVNENDNAGLAFTPATLTIAEGGPAATYTIALTSQPTANVIVTIDGQGQVTLNGQPTLTLTFTPTTWNVSQTIAVQAIDDLIDEAPIGTSYDVVLLHAFSGGDPVYAALPSAPFTITILENDNAGFNFTPTSLTMIEGVSASYNLTLASAPTDDVVVTIDGQGFLLVNGNATATLTFTPGNWNVAQTVTLLEPDIDQIAQLARARLVLHSASSSDPVYDSLSGIGLPVTVNDNDIPGIIPSEIELTVTEGGIASYTIELNTQPTENVTVTIDGQGVALINGVPVANIIFTPTNWNTPQLVTIFVPDDNIAEANQTIFIPQTASSADPFYDGLAGPSIELTILDNDPPGFIITTPFGPLVVTESGDSVTLQIRLASQPTAPVQLSVSVSDPSEGSVTPNTIIFDNTNWNLDTTLIVSGVNDTLEDGHQPFVVQFAPAISADPFYDGLIPSSLNFTNRDNEPVRIRINDVTRLEGNSGVANANFVVQLNRISDRDILIDYTTTDGTAITGLDYNAITGTLTIPAGQILVSLPVGIIGETLSEDDEFFTVNLSNPRATMPGMPGLPASDETVVLTDGLGTGIIRNDDPPALRFAASNIFANESVGVATVTVTLSQVTTSTVTVNYATIPGGTAQAGDGSSTLHDYEPVSGLLSFAPGVVSQTFTIPLWNNSAADAPFETVLVALDNPIGANLGEPATATVTIIDSNPTLLTQNPTALQTAGPNYNDYGWNFYNSSEGASVIRIDVPCGVSGGLVVELLSPSINPTTNPRDVIRGSAETATFALYRMPTGWQAGDGYPPSTGTLVTSATYAPNTGDATTWVSLPGISGPTPCGIYLLLSSVPDNDTNGWAARSGWAGSGSPTVDLDGIPGTGDEIVQGILRQSLRHPPGTPVCTTFYQYVAPGQSSVAFHNFDLEGENPSRAWVRYYPPGSLYDPTGQSGGIAGTASFDGQWNNGTATTRGGDVIANPTPGWWQIVTCTSSFVDENHFAQEGQTGVPIYLTPPPAPELTLQATPSATTIPAGSAFNLTIDYTNQAGGPTAGAARDLQLTITLSEGIGFVAGACASAPGACSVTGQVMTIDLGLLAAGVGNTFTIPLVAGSSPVGAAPIAIQATAVDQIGNPYVWAEYAIIRVTP